MKKRIAAAVAAMAALLAVGGTMAWFTDEEKAASVINTGNVNIQIVEQTKEPEGTYEKTVDGITFWGNFMPGQTFSKIVTVKNQGANRAYVRLKVSYQDHEKKELVYEARMAPVLESSGLGTYGDSWELASDGYYYYNQALEPGAESAPVLETVKLPLSWETAQTSALYLVAVHAEAIQADYTGSTAKEAFNYGEKAPGTAMAKAEGIVKKFLDLEEKYNAAGSDSEEKAYLEEAQKLLGSTKDKFVGMKNNDEFRRAILSEYGGVWPTVADEGLAEFFGLTEEQAQSLYVNVYVAHNDGCQVIPYVNSVRASEGNKWAAMYIYVDGYWYKPITGKSLSISRLYDGWSTISMEWKLLNE